MMGHGGSGGGCNDRTAMVIILWCCLWWCGCIIITTVPPTDALIVLPSTRLPSRHHHHSSSPPPRVMMVMRAKPRRNDDPTTWWRDDEEDEEKLQAVAASTAASSLLLPPSLVYTVTEEDDGKRLDSVVASVLLSTRRWSRSQCSTLITSGKVQVNGQTELKKSTPVTTGMQLSLFTTGSTSDHSTTATVITPQELPLHILYEDDDMIVLNKAAGMVVHPAVGNWDGTVVHALAYHYIHNRRSCGIPHQENDEDDDPPFLPPNELMDDDDDNDDNDDDALLVDENEPPTSASSSSSLRPGIVHRLDKGTTGVLVVAKTRTALAALAAQFGSNHTSSRRSSSIGTGSKSSNSSSSSSADPGSPSTPLPPRAEKTYLAITVGNPGQRVVINRPIGRHPIHRQRMRVVPDPTQSRPRHQSRSRTTTTTPKASVSQGRRAVSFVDTLAYNGKLALAQVRIETGRTHQIRVHLQDRHTPIYGDDVYGNTDWNDRLQRQHQIRRPLLHAWRLTIQHPRTQEGMTFVAPLPDDLKQIIHTIDPQWGNDDDGCLKSSPDTVKM